MSDIKPCPFCGTEPVSYAGYGAMNITCARCSYSVPSVIWNFRPIEDALTALLRQALADATVPASAVEMAEKSLEVISLRSCVRELEAKLEQAMAPHDDPENAMHCACVPPMRRRIAELESAIAYTDGRNPVTVVVELQQRIRELEAIIIEASNAYNLPGAEPDTDVDIAAVALVRMCHEGRAALDDAACPYCELLAETQQRVRELEAQLAAMPQWTRITDDPATWPPVADAWVLVAVPMGDRQWLMYATYGHTISSYEGRIFEKYWQPITPPQP